MQVLQPFFKTLHTLNILPGWSKGCDIFCAKLANFGKHQQPTSLCTVLLDFEVRAPKLTFGYILVVETGKTYSGVDASFHFSKLTGGQYTVTLPLIKKLLLQKSQKHLS